MLLDVVDLTDDMQIRGPLHETLVGKSDFICEVRDLINKLAPTELAVLVTGETGTGKDIVARLLHNKSTRHAMPFIKVNSPAIPHNLFESELFGHEKGAFTGAARTKPGRFELAHRGTIFLDEIAEISMDVQSKLVQVLDGEPFMRVGGVNPINTDVRVVAATNVEIDNAVKHGRLRRDITFRLSECTITMLPLRERVEDIPLLVEHFNYNFSKQFDKEYIHIPDEISDKMQKQLWRGNIRELAARLKEYAVSGDYNVLTSEETLVNQAIEIEEDKTAPLKPEKKIRSLREATQRAVEETERALIADALEYTLWNRKKAAKLLDISYSSLLRRISTYNIGKM